MSDVDENVRPEMATSLTVNVAMTLFGCVAHGEVSVTVPLLVVEWAQQPQVRQVGEPA